MYNHNKKLVKEKFNSEASKYDKYRRLIIPHFDLFYGTLIELSNSAENHSKILDLGAGTGLLSKFLRERYPQGKFYLIDLSEDMLNIAKTRFEGQNNFEYILGDYVNYDFEESFDLIVSSLSIHHLTHQEKFQLYQKIYALLNEGGIFLNADLVIGNSPFNEKNYQTNWLDKIEENKMEESYKKAAIKRMDLDQPATLEENIGWLKNSCFKDVDVYYKYYNFVVIFGRKK